MSLFDDVALKITEIDTGGKAGRQLDITEASQALRVVLKVLKQMPFGDVVKLISSQRRRAVMKDCIYQCDSGFCLKEKV